jgi:hypothetical protein
MSPEKFKEYRQKLELTQVKLSSLLGFKTAKRGSDLQLFI